MLRLTEGALTQRRVIVITASVAAERNNPLNVFILDAMKERGLRSWRMLAFVRTSAPGGTTFIQRWLARLAFVAIAAALLGVAGGDGTQALVAGVAAEHDVPLLVISAGTRNHFAQDLGLDREDPARCLDALVDGVELHVDLGFIGERPFVNNASFGAYALVVQSPAYRDDKAGTILELLPELLIGHRGPRLVARAGKVTAPGA